jgi:hypothetical protein
MVSIYLKELAASFAQTQYLPAPLPPMLLRLRPLAVSFDMRLAKPQFFF